MKFEYYCPRWGYEHLTWDDFFRYVKEVGYHGVEYAIASSTPEQELHQVWNLAERHGATMIPQHFDTYHADFNQHYDHYAAWLEKLKGFSAPKIDSQTGKDFFTSEQNQSLIAVATEFTTATGVAVLHETHRNKFSFAAHITKAYLEALPDLRITLDVSHWVNVSESYLHDQPEALRLAIERTDHIHARVGYPEGPQVPDPRAPEWSEALETHLAWWDRVIERKRAAGESVMTITPEFGAPPYTVLLPYTQEPIASQREINEYMMNLLKERYG